MPSNPNSLAIMLGMQPKHYASPDEALFEPTEAELMDMQEAEVAPLRNSGHAYSVPSRDSLKQSASDAMRRMLKLNEISAQQKAYPDVVKGQTVLAQEQMKGEYSVEAARAAAERAALERETQREFSAGQNELNRNAISNRQERNIDATDTRFTTGQSNLAQRQEAQRRAQRRQQIETGKLNIPRKPGIYDLLFGPSQAERNQAELQSLAGQDTGAGPSDEEVAAAYDMVASQFPGHSIADLIQAGVITGTPEQLQALQAHEAMRGR